VARGVLHDAPRGVAMLMVSIVTPKPCSSRSIDSIRRRWYCLLLSGLGVLSAGCIAAPVRMSPQVQGPPGVAADHTFIRVGQTSRQEVLQRLGWADVGLNENRLFWGRWFASSSGTVVVLVLPGAMGADRQRNWSIQNLMIEFDERDVVGRVVEKIEDKNVVRELVAWSQRSGYRPANPSSIRNSFAASTQRGTWTQGLRRTNGSMRVSADSLEFFGVTSTPCPASRVPGPSACQSMAPPPQSTRFNVPHDRIGSLKLKPYGGVKVSYTLKLKDKTPWGKEIQLGIASNELLPVLAYITPQNP
jgi:hypothetical protein